MILLILVALNLFALFVSVLLASPLPWHLSLRAAVFWLLFSNIIEWTEIQKSAPCTLAFFIKILPSVVYAAASGGPPLTQ